MTIAQELGRRGLSDEEQLTFAAAEGRCLVTQDYGDFRKRTDEFREQGRLHAGVLLVPQSIVVRGNSTIATSLARYDRERRYPLVPYEIGWLTLAR